MMNNERKNALYEKLEDIYDEFSGQLIIAGWNGELLGYTETSRCELDGSGYKVFCLDNGFRMILTNPAVDGEEDPSLMYNFDEDDIIEVDTLEELQKVLLLIVD